MKRSSLLLLLCPSLVAFLCCSVLAPGSIPTAQPGPRVETGREGERGLANARMMAPQSSSQELFEIDGAAPIHVKDLSSMSSQRPEASKAETPRSELQRTAGLTGASSNLKF